MFLSRPKPEMAWLPELFPDLIKGLARLRKSLGRLAVMRKRIV